ncbi:UDP-N-acetylmuramoyl-tripeptide--D-alanyl-D-alanine ligase, partial [Oceanihabitans sp.]|nr:UDP-N-acetylmuramoyl-tripeptide--D-alanyl-D-alanine ligase [Oceanihabitans sp.]
GKTELYNYLIANNKYIFLNADDDIQIEKLGTYVKKEGFTQNKDDFYKITLLEANPFCEIAI